MNQTLTVRHGDFTLALNSINTIAQLPVTKCRKLFTEMLLALDENTESLHQLRSWFLKAESDAREAVMQEQCRLDGCAANTKRTELNKRSLYLQKIISRRDLFEALCTKYLNNNGGKHDHTYHNC